MRWVEALKIWNAEHNPGKWCVARKGSKEYDEVKAIMARDKPAEKKGVSKAEIMERIKAKKAKKVDTRTNQEAIDESDALLKEIDAFLEAEKKPAPSAPKAPSRDLAAEAREISKIAGEHAERYGKDQSKRALVKSFLRQLMEHRRKVKEHETEEKRKMDEAAAEKKRKDEEFLQKRREWEEADRRRAAEEEAERNAIFKKDVVTYDDISKHDANFGSGNWINKLISISDNKHWSIPLLPKPSRQAALLKEQWPKMTNAQINAVLRSANVTRKSFQNEYLEIQKRKAKEAKEEKKYEAKVAREEAKAAKPPRSKAPLKGRKEAPKEESGRTPAQQKLHLSNMINITEETLMSVEAKLRSPTTTPGQRVSLTKQVDMLKKSIESMKGKLRKL